MKNRNLKFEIRNGFTLVELLVVVAIIVVLLAILLPSMERAMTYALRAKCGAHQHMWGLALAQYAAENNQYFPDNRDGWDTSWCGANVRSFWAKYLVEYKSQGKNDVLDCPTQVFHPAVREATNETRGLIGYFYLPSRAPGAAHNPMDYTPAGNAWVDKTKFGKFSAAPILMDMKQSVSNDRGATNTWTTGTMLISSHVEGGYPSGEPDGGNFLFEGGNVNWIMSKDVGVGGVTSNTGVAWYRIPGVPLE